MNNCIDSDVTKATAEAASKPTSAARLQGVRNIVTITGRISHKSEGNYDTALMMLLLSGSYRQHDFDDISTKLRSLKNVCGFSCLPVLLLKMSCVSHH